mmetsp:Transcript_9532/g.43147  ORF Transcript_9532/g.43147 Transcript_9532/m.43147 type:complete len:279 (+) Transcript_9532:2647-3483(+)
MFCCVWFRPVNVLGSKSAALPPAWMALAAAVIVAAVSPRTGMAPRTADTLACFNAVSMVLFTCSRTWSPSPPATPAVETSEPRLSDSASNPPRPPSSGACAILRALWLALEYACCNRLVLSSRSSTWHSSIRRFCSSSSSTDLTSVRFWSPGEIPAWTLVMSRSRDFILRKGHRLMPNLRHWRFNTVSPMPSFLHAASEGRWKHDESSSWVISDADRRGFRFGGFSPPCPPSFLGLGLGLGLGLVDPLAAPAMSARSLRFVRYAPSSSSSSSSSPAAS